MSIATQLNDIVDLKETIKEALIDKGVTVEDNFSLTDIPDIIESGVGGNTGDTSSIGAYNKLVLNWDDIDKQIKISKRDSSTSVSGLPQFPTDIDPWGLYNYKNKLLINNKNTKYYLLNEDLTWTTISKPTTYKKFCIFENVIFYTASSGDLFLYDDDSNSFIKTELNNDEFVSYMNSDNIVFNSFKINDRILYTAIDSSNSMNASKHSINEFYYSYDTPTNWQMVEFYLPAQLTYDTLLCFNNKICLPVADYATDQVDLYVFEPDFSSHIKIGVNSGNVLIGVMYTDAKIVNNHLILRYSEYMSRPAYFDITVNVDGSYDIKRYKHNESSTSSTFDVIDDGKTILSYINDNPSVSYPCVSYDYGKTWTNNVPSDVYARTRFNSCTDYSAFKYDFEPFKLTGDFEFL